MTMHTVRWLFAKGFMVATIACCVGSLAGCIVIQTNESNGEEVRRSISKIWPRREGGDELNNEQLSLKGSAAEFGRGVTNVAFCWLELPYELEEGVRGNSEPGLGGILGTAWGLATGAIQGVLGTAGRAVGGVLEIALSPFPPHGPLMNPSRPPYLNFKRKASKQEPAPSEEAGPAATPTAELPGDDKDAT